MLTRSLRALRALMLAFEPRPRDTNTKDLAACALDRVLAHTHSSWSAKVWPVAYLLVAHPSTGQTKSREDKPVFSAVSHGRSAHFSVLTRTYGLCICTQVLALELRVRLDADELLSVWTTRQHRGCASLQSGTRSARYEAGQPSTIQSTISGRTALKASNMAIHLFAPDGHRQHPGSLD